MQNIILKKALASTNRGRALSGVKFGYQWPKSRASVFKKVNRTRFITR